MDHAAVQRVELARPEPLPALLPSPECSKDCSHGSFDVTDVLFRYVTFGSAGVSLY